VEFLEVIVDSVFGESLERKYLTDDESDAKHVEDGVHKGGKYLQYFIYPAIACVVLYSAGVLYYLLRSDVI
jgi:hypothetical protein